MTPPKNSLLVICLAMFTIGCDSATKNGDGAHEKPAKVEMLPVETQLALVTLSADADKRLGIKTVAVVSETVEPRRTLGGQAFVPIGNTIAVSAPVAGIVSRPSKKPIPIPGTHVERGDALLNLVPMLSPERDVPTPAEQVQLVGARANLVAAQTVSKGDVDRSQAEVDAAKIALNRAEKLFQDRAGPRKAVDDAQGLLNVSQSVLEAATEREKQLGELLKTLQQPSTSSEEVIALPLSTPISGIVNRLDISEGQSVSSGALLFEIVNLDTIWVRVPVFVDLLPTIETDKHARLVSLSGDTLKLSADAKPIAAPPTADAMTSSADLYYEVDNRELGLRPGQRIGVELPLKGATESLVVPSASILYDVNGGAWVYVMSGKRQYQRHPVSIRWADGDKTILAMGPTVGTEVVVDGAAELFGTEFGTGK